MEKGSLHRWERVLYIVILILAVLSRFYILGDRAISHDESIHTKFSWNLYNGDGFQHNPMMHGPLLFEATALIYAIFGVSDFTSRIFIALAGIGLVLSPVLFRKWLGQYGSLIASVMLLISPSISYYSRYIRHDIPLALTGILLLWVVFKYMEEGLPKWLYWLAAVFALMYTTKEASYIYTAIFGVILFIPMVGQIVTLKWKRPQYVIPVVTCMILVLLLGSVFIFSFRNAPVNELSLDSSGESRVAEIVLPIWGRIAAATAFCLAFVIILLISNGVGRQVISQLRLYDVLIVIGSLTLPLGSAFLMKYMGGVDMETVYEAVKSGNLSIVPSETLFIMSSILVVTLIISIAIGLWWNSKQWFIIALIHYSIFFVTYTTIFTWGFGVISGLIGGLAYWLAQHGVQRGNQPNYYYGLIGILYEYLSILFSIVGGVLAIGLSVRNQRKDKSELTSASSLKTTFPLFLTAWLVLSWIAYTWAGEKMPWLYVHIALPSILLSGWTIGHLVEEMGWVKKQVWSCIKYLSSFVVVIICAFIGFQSATGLLAAYKSGTGPSGPTLIQLGLFGKTAGAFAVLILFGIILIRTIKHLGWSRIWRLTGIFVAIMLALFTIRTSVMLNYQNYDLATELLVYAHGTPDIKIALNQIEELSWRLTGSPYDIKVAYGEDGSWPLTWYMVDYPNNYFYSTTPDPERLKEYPAVIAGSAQYGAVSDILGDNYIHFDYKYLWWPIQDYYDLTFVRIRDSLLNPEMRSALWQIVWNRDYTRYAALKNPLVPFDLEKWPYRKEFRLYIQKDIANDVWSYKVGDSGLSGLRPVPTELPDPYRIGEKNLLLLNRLELPGAVLRGIDSAPDGSIYTTDTANHKIWHLDANGTILGSIGSYGVENGQFIEPWDVAIDENGYIYVADTWNHRIQKFDQQGNFVISWGTLAQIVTLNDPAGNGVFYGPRGIAYNGQGELFVADTGNKRIQVFDINGDFLREFGGFGDDAGFLDEPVGIDIDPDGLVAVADTWNLRVQFFTQEGVYIRLWSVPVWDKANPDEKPFVTVDRYLVFVSDAVRRRILVFNMVGDYQWALGADAGAEISFPQGLLIVRDVLWVADAHEGRIFTYQLPD